MLLVVDVGNTHITLGVFDGKDVKATFRATTKQPRTSDEYGIQLCDLLEHRNFNIADITDVIISVIVYLSAFSLLIRVWLGGRKKKDTKAATAVTNADNGDQQKGGQAQ